MIDLKHVTFNIPIKIDFAERLENVKLAVEYLLHHFDTNIIVYEVSNGNPQYTDRDPRVKYIFENIGDKPFHRTRYLNEMAVMSRTPIIVNYDCDVLMQPQNYVKAANLITKGGFTGVFPYDGLFVNVPRVHIPQIKSTKDLTFIEVEKTENFGSGSVGGALMWHRQGFIAGGMENENFISWGCEDWERIKRFVKLGFKMARIPGPLYHMSHPRGNDSCESNPFYKKNQEIYSTIEHADVKWLQSYVKEQPWMRDFVGVSL